MRWPDAEKNEGPTEAPTLQARPVDIYALQLTEARPDSADFTVRCGKGTYIRSLARDMARALGSAGHITTLRRTKVGKFQAAQAISLDLLEKISDSAAALQRNAGFDGAGRHPGGGHYQRRGTPVATWPVGSSHRYSVRRRNRGGGC